MSDKGMKYRDKKQKETKKGDTTKRRQVYEEEDMEEMPSPKRPRDDLSCSERSKSPSNSDGNPAREGHSSEDRSSEDLSRGGRSGQDRSRELNRPMMIPRRRTLNERETFGRQKIPANAHAYIPTNAPDSGFSGRGQGDPGANIPGRGQRHMPKKDVRYCEATSTTDSYHYYDSAVENNAAMEMDDE